MSDRLGFGLQNQPGGSDSHSGLIMKALKIVILILVIVVVAGIAGFFGLKYLKPQKAQISVESNPVAAVYIGGSQVGNTPYKGSLDAGEITLKLVPADPLLPYEAKVNLIAGQTTSVLRNFGSSEDVSGGQVISFEKIGKNDSSLSLVSTPDYAQVSIDGNIRGFSPIMNYAVTPDTHQIAVTKIGFVDSSFAITTQKGYKTVVVAKLISTGEAVATPSATASVSASSAPTVPGTKVYVQILDTPSGFLRVRKEGSTTADEVARVKPGDKLLFVSQNTAGDWYQVVYEGTKTGWVFSQYAKKLDQTGNTPI